jgi:hypothetical protein
MKRKVNYVALLILLSTIYTIATSNYVQACCDFRPPRIEVISPKNDTYAINSVPLIFTVNEETSWTGYTVDGQINATILGNTTLTSLLDGAHYVVVYANDTRGNMGASNTVYFAVDTTPPNITDVSQLPLENNVLPENDVKINASITDNFSGVKRATLIYAHANSSGAWIRIIDMANIEGNVWNATIPPFPYCTNVTYTIQAEDDVGNTITTEEMGYEYHYHVITEFQSLVILLLFLIATLLTASACTKRKLKT